jgi:hypothetical protein
MGLAVTLPEYLSLRGTRLAASWVALPILLLFALAGFASAAEAQAAGLEDGPASPGRVWLGPDGNPLPFKTDEEVMEFMRTAKVVSVREIGEGITRPEVVMLEKEGIQMRAHFQSHSGFRDTYLFNIAAYKLGVMLGLDNIPPSVRGKVKGKWGSLTIWLEKTMTDKRRQAKKIVPPELLRWNRQMYRIWLFDELIGNIDRNQGNLLIDEGWNLWMIDHTRAFRRGKKLMRPERIRQFDRKLWDKILVLDEEEVKTRLKELLSGSEVKAIFKRRDQLAKHIQKLVDEHGEAQIFYTLD